MAGSFMADGFLLPGARGDGSPRGKPGSQDTIAYSGPKNWVFMTSSWSGLQPRVSQRFQPNSKM